MPKVRHLFIAAALATALATQAGAAPSPAIDLDSSLLPRHGDHEHDEMNENQPEAHTMDHDHGAQGELKPEQQHAAHSHMDHAHPSSLVIPVASDLDPSLRPIPVYPHSSGHSHMHGGGPSLAVLNETKLFKERGASPLSYIEWDFGYQLGTAENLRRFTAPEVIHSVEGQLMGSVEDRWRRLLDERDDNDRRRITAQIADLVLVDGQAAEPPRHAWLMLLHVISASLSCFVLLPAALALRAAASSLAPLASVVYLSSLLGSLLLASLYKALTPRLYAPNSHSGMGWAVFWISAVCLCGDAFTFVRQVLSAVSSAGTSTSSRLRAVAASIFRSSGPASRTQTTTGYDAMEEESMLKGEEDVERDSGSRSPPRVHFEDSSAWGARHAPARTGSHDSSETLSAGSTACNTPRDSFLGLRGEHKRAASFGFTFGKRMDGAELEDVGEKQGLPASREKKRAGLLRAILRYTHVTVARSMPIVAFATAYSGLAVYTGSCRSGAYQNACLAHGIKGGIFAWYGVLTFARYLGAYAELGWAWNCRPSRQTAAGSGKRTRGDGAVTAEWVECLVIFIYGSTNVWMERFGAKPGDPYSVRQVQHISIAVMFCFAGLVGLLLETRWVRDLLAFPVALRHPAARKREGDTAGPMSTENSSGDDDARALVLAQTPPPSYSGSFNPFPALVIAVTGLAMSAHHQDYIYEVEIHMLWGYLLAAFSMLRCLTYFFLWLRPPASVLPSRPPTEALAGFALTCGGLVFMLSSEEVSYAAMRHGFGDMMAIMNMSVAFVSLVFVGIVLTMMLKAWAMRRERRLVRGRPSTSSPWGPAPSSDRGIDARHAQRGRRQESTSSEQTAVFVLEDEEDKVERDAGAESGRQLSSSPDLLPSS